MSEIRKELGKIAKVGFGHCGYQEAMIGIHFTLSMAGSTVVAERCFWDRNLIEVTDSHSWGEEERSEEYTEIMCYVSDLLSQAKVHDVADLKGIPVEVTLDGNMLKSWRILIEVL